MPDSTTIFGPPGSGKTTTLVRNIARAVERFGRDRVAVASLTRAAAAEIASRDIDVSWENVGTLHALCYRAMDRPKVMDGSAMSEFNRMYGRVLTGGTDGDDLLADGQYGKTDSDRLLAHADLLRARMVDRELWPPRVREFAEEWEAFKQFSGRIDFTDMLEWALANMPEPPGGARAFFYDEAQDGSKLELELVKKWAARTDHTVIAGDDDQCCTIGSMITTPSGLVKAEHLDPEVHRLVSLDLHGSYVVGKRNGYPFTMARREYEGDVVTISTESNETTTTPDHRWITRWARGPKSWVVYLMRKGTKFRVGYCQLFQSSGCLHVGIRASMEGADAFWILRECQSKAEAYEIEAYIAAYYGLPMVVFNAVRANMPPNSCYSQECVDSIFERLGDLTSRAEACLRDHHRRIEHPFYAPGEGLRRGGSQKFLTRACNLMPSMLVPTLKDGLHTWERITKVEIKPYRGEVFSFNVEPHHNYCQDGIFVHNCIFEWRGASVRDFLAFSERKIVLRQTYRLARAVHAYAQRWAAQIGVRQPKDYSPRDEDGSVVMGGGTLRRPELWLPEVEEHLAGGRSVMILATCGYMLLPTLAAMRERGLPFHNPYRVQQGAWNPLGPHRGTGPAQRLVLFARLRDPAAEPWTRKELREWTAHLRAEKLVKGAKSRDDEERDGPMEFADVERAVGAEALNAALAADVEWFADALLASKARMYGYPLAVARRRGLSALEHHLGEVQGKPGRGLTIGTIHSGKGGEADVIYLWPTLSAPAMGQWVDGARDEILRVLYVGITRARQRVVLGEPGRDMAVPWLPVEVG